MSQKLPIDILRQHYAAGEPRAFALPATADPALWANWRAGLRLRLHELLGLEATSYSAPEVNWGELTQQDGYQRRYLEYQGADGEQVPAWLLIPDNATQPAPAVLAIHGHGPGANDLVGLNPDGSAQAEVQGYHQQFAIELCRRGLIVLVPELRGFGRRRDQVALESGQPGRSSCLLFAGWGLMLGKPLLGNRVADTLLGLELLRSLPSVHAERIGIMGGSGGGAVAMFSAALDKRLRATVISNYFCTFHDSILAMEHCACNYLPGLLANAESYDIAGLIAPRPLLIVSGTSDPIFPLHGVTSAYAKLSAAYAHQGAADQLAQDLFDGGHIIHGPRAYEFLRAELHKL